MAKIPQVMINRNVNEMSTKSEIILFITSHGEDLNEPLEQYKPFLIFTLANKDSPSYIKTEADELSLFSIESIFYFLNKELKEKNRRIIDVMNQLSTDFYNDYNYSENCEKGIECFNVVEQKIGFLPIEHEIGRESIKKVLSDYNSDLIAKPRVIKNDRLYIGDNINIGAIDIRYPKSAKQIQKNEEGFFLINDVIESKIQNEQIKLSDVLDICYKDYDFDHVTIFDFACRDCLYKSKTKTKQEIKQESINQSIKEIIDGEKLLRNVYIRNNLGGKKITKRKRKITKRRIIKRKRRITKRKNNKKIE